jgi:uncharacterized protein (DUF4415 family)
MSRIAGIALIALGFACWPGGVARVLQGMAVCSTVAAAYMAVVGLTGGQTGMLWWPAFATHGSERIPKHYDFSKSRPNPYVRKAKRSVRIRLDEDTVQSFKVLAGGTGIPYQNLINLYLRDCAAEKKRLKMQWAA